MTVENYHLPSFHEHELAVEAVALELGFTNISLSHKVMQMIKLVPRGHTGRHFNFLNSNILIIIKSNTFATLFIRI